MDPKNYDKTPWFDLFDPGLPVWSWCLSFFRCNAPYCLFGTLQGILRKLQTARLKKNTGFGPDTPKIPGGKLKVFFGISYVRILGGGVATPNSSIGSGVPKEMQEGFFLSKHCDSKELQELATNGNQRPEHVWLAFCLVRSLCLRWFCFKILSPMVDWITIRENPSYLTTSQSGTLMGKWGFITLY